MKTQRETPSWLAKEMSRILLKELYENQEHSDNVKDINVLEPSCGSGVLIEELLNITHVNRIIGVELNNDLSDFCKETYSNHKRVRIERGDFSVRGRELIKEENILASLMCPPFKNNIHIEHIKLILECWNETNIYGTRGPVIVSLIHNSFWTDNSKLSTEFREIITHERYDVKFKPIPDNTFIEKGKSVPCSVMVLKYIY